MVPTFHYVMLLISPFSPPILESSSTLWSISSSSCNLLTAGSSSLCGSSLHQAAKNFLKSQIHHSNTQSHFFKCCFLAKLFQKLKQKYSLNTCLNPNSNPPDFCVICICLLIYKLVSSLTVFTSTGYLAQKGEINNFTMNKFKQFKMEILI